MSAPTLEQAFHPLLLRAGRALGKVWSKRDLLSGASARLDKSFIGRTLDLSGVRESRRYFMGEISGAFSRADMGMPVGDQMFARAGIAAQDLWSSGVARDYITSVSNYYRGMNPVRTHLPGVNWKRSAARIGTNIALPAAASFGAWYLLSKQGRKHPWLLPSLGLVTPAIAGSTFAYAKFRPKQFAMASQALLNHIGSNFARSIG